MSAHRTTCPACAKEFRAPLGSEITVETNAHLQLQRHMAEAHRELTFVCPRQAENPVYRGSGATYWEADRTCSYCGSIHPEDFLNAVANGGEVTPTDKSYKAYIDLPNPDASVRRVVGASTGQERPGDHWVSADTVTDEQLVEAGWSPNAKPGGQGHRYHWFLIDTVGPTRRAKFYFQHLSPTQREHFIDLYNSQTMKLAYPHYFYARPYFVAPKAD